MLRVQRCLEYRSCFDQADKGIEISGDFTGEKNKTWAPGGSRGAFNQIMECQVFANRSCDSSKDLFMFMPH